MKKKLSSIYKAVAILLVASLFGSAMAEPIGGGDGGSRPPAYCRCVHQAS